MKVTCSGSLSEVPLGEEGQSSILKDTCDKHYDKHAKVKFTQNLSNTGMA